MARLARFRSHEAAAVFNSLLGRAGLPQFLVRDACKIVGLRARRQPPEVLGDGDELAIRLPGAVGGIVVDVLLGRRSRHGQRRGIKVKGSAERLVGGAGFHRPENERANHQQREPRLH